MDNTYIIMTDSSTDLPRSYYEKNDVVLIPIHFIMDDVEYKDDAGQTMDNKEFYSKLRQGSKSSTSMINLQEYIHEFESVLKAGKDLIYISISSGISGSYESAKNAAEELAPNYPDRKLYVCDGLCASMGGALIVHKAVKLRNEGKSVDEVRDWVEENKRRVIHLFTVDDLMFLKRGGRVSPAAAVVGSIVGVKPMLDVDPQGSLRPRHKKRGRKGALDGLVEWMGELVKSKELEIFTISHGDCEDEAKYVLSKVKERFKIKDILTNPIGPVIGSHSGPGTIAIFFLAENDRT